LKLRRISMVSPRHAKIANDKLWEEGEVESDIHYQSGKLPELFGIHSAGNLRPPIMQPAHEGRDHSSDHYVMKMSDDEVSVSDVHINRQCCQEKQVTTSLTTPIPGKIMM